MQNNYLFICIYEIKVLPLQCLSKERYMLNPNFYGYGLVQKFGKRLQ